MGERWGGWGYFSMPNRLHIINYLVKGLGFEGWVGNWIFL